jgi:sulfate permease, SulP family
MPPRPRLPSRPYVSQFRQIKQAADGCGTRLALVNMTREIESAFRITGVISDDVLVVSDLDHALEQCENEIIKAHRAPEASQGRCLHG